MRNLENTKIGLFIRLKISRNKKNIKENKYEVILCITNFEKGTDYMFRSTESSRQTECNLHDNVNSYYCDKPICGDKDRQKHNV